MDAFGMSIGDLADGLLSRILDRVVIDKTGQAGLFDFHLEFTPDDVTPAWRSANTCSSERTTWTVDLHGIGGATRPQARIDERSRRSSRDRPR